MVNAVVLLNVERTQINAVAEKLADLEHVSEVYSVSGRYDLIALIRVMDVDDLASVVTREISQVEGIVHSETLLAFQTYSKHDLDRLFSVGGEGP